MYAVQPVQMSEAEYLAFEAESELKHELINSVDLPGILRSMHSS
jgi:hypothetical protein